MQQLYSGRFARFWAPLLVALLTLRAARASRSRLRGPVATQVQIVQGLESKLARVLRSENLLPAPLAGEARRVQADATRALSLLGSGSGSKRNLSANVTFDGVLAEYRAFAAHLTRVEADLAKAAARAGEASNATREVYHPAESTEERAKELADVLEGKVRHVLAHLRTDQGLDRAEVSERDSLVRSLELALNMSSADNMTESSNGDALQSPIVKRALQLHKALASAHGFLLKRAQELNRRQARLAAEVESQEVHLLMSMLGQRRKLPMKAQFALLRRRQFANCSYARRLLASHREDQPLYEQLIALLPEGERPSADGSSSEGRLDAAGSEGRVQVVTSELKNNVQGMLRQLTGARDKLRQISNATGVSAAEREEARQILTGLDESLDKVKRASSAGFGAELEALSQVQNELAVWMKTFTRNLRS